MNLIETLHNIMEPPSNFQDELISDAFPGDEIKAVAIRGTVLKRGTLYILPIKGTKVFLV